MVDKQKIEQAVRLLLEGIGEDTEREGLKETPARIARMYEELMAGMDEDAAVHLSKTFTSQNTGIVLERISPFIPCVSIICFLLRKAHVAYIPDGKVVGLSKLARTVEVFARRLQLQEQLTDQIADALMDELGVKGAMVMVQAEHMCMTMRGIKKPGSQTVSIATRGCFIDNEALQNTFSRCCTAKLWI